MKWFTLLIEWYLANKGSVDQFLIALKELYDYFSAPRVSVLSDSEVTGVLEGICDRVEAKVARDPGVASFRSDRASLYQLIKLLFDNWDKLAPLLPILLPLLGLSQPTIAEEPVSEVVYEPITGDSGTTMENASDGDGSPTDPASE